MICWAAACVVPAVKSTYCTYRAQKLLPCVYNMIKTRSMCIYFEVYTSILCESISSINSHSYALCWMPDKAASSVPGQRITSAWERESNSSSKAYHFGSFGAHLNVGIMPFHARREEECKSSVERQRPII